MKLKNPNYIDPVDTYIATHTAAIQGFFAERTTDEFIAFDDVRARFPGEAANLTDGMIAEICQRLNIAVASE